LPAGVGLPAYQPEKIGPELEKQTIQITHKYFLQRGSENTFRI